MGRNPETMPPNVLCPYLATFMRELKKADGTDYEPDTINFIQGSIDRHLREQGYPYSVIESSEFKMVKEVVEAKRKMLKASGKGNKPNAQMALTDEEVVQLLFQGGFGRSNPTELNRLFTVEVRPLDTVYVYKRNFHFVNTPFQNISHKLNTSISTLYFPMCKLYCNLHPYHIIPG